MTSANSSSRPMPDRPTGTPEEEARGYAEVAAMVQRVRDFLGDAPDDLPFSRTVQDPTPWGTMEVREEETPLTTADLRAMCDVVEILAAQAKSRTTLLAELRGAVLKLGIPAGDGSYDRDATIYNDAIQDVLAALDRVGEGA